MIEARFAANGAFLKALVDSVQDIVKEANFDFSHNGLSMQAMDSSHVCLLSIELPQTAFSHFRCDHPTTIGMSLTALAKLLKCCGNDDIVTLQQSNDDVLTFMFESPDGNRVSDFELKLMNIDSEMLQVPDTEFPAEVQMSSSLLTKICKDLKELDDVLTISTDSKSGVTFSVDGAVSKGRVVLRSGTEDITIRSEGTVTAKYSLRYLNMFTRASVLSSSVSFKMSADLPLVVKYEVVHGGQVQFFLAPKMADE